MHHSTFIGHMASIYKPKVYVELGLYEGETLSKVAPYITKGYGVDLKSNAHLDRLASDPKLTICYKHTDEFFVDFDQKIDMAFIDADHNVNSALKDFQNVMKHLNPGGIVFLHDTDPEENRLFHPGYCGDSYKIVKILEELSEFNVLTMPLTNAGLSIVTRKKESRTALRGFY